MRVSIYCADCLERLEAPVAARGGHVACGAGHPPIAFEHSSAVRGGERVDRCSRCGTSAVFVQRDFDQRVGCLVLALGAALALAIARLFGGVWFVPALLAVAGLDVLLASRVGWVVICYRCDTEYREVKDARAYKPYDPHIAERDAELKTVRRMNP